jgi:Ca2+-transporting ATPase
VAREASSLVLLDDDFSSVVGAVRHGRRIYDNLRKAMAYIVAVHVPIAGIALLPLVTGGPLLLTPILIAFLELIIDPACSVVLEAEKEEPDIMARPPRDPQAKLLSGALMTWGVIQGAIAFIAVSVVYVGSLRSGFETDEIRAMTFVSLVAVNLAMIFSSRTFSYSIASVLGRPNAALGWGVGIVGGILTLVLAVSTLRGFFGFGDLDLRQLLLAFIVALPVIAILQLTKRFYGTHLMA